MLLRAIIYRKVYKNVMRQLRRRLFVDQGIFFSRVNVRVQIKRARFSHVIFQVFALFIGSISSKVQQNIKKIKGRIPSEFLDRFQECCVTTKWFVFQHQVEKGQISQSNEF